MKTSAICMTLLFFATGAMAAAESLTISRITPSGAAVEAVRQIVIQFGQPVVPLGRMERKDSEIPITIQPALDCHWRWVDRSALACQLGDKEKMSLATTYKVTVRPGIRTEGGGTISQTVEHKFTTIRPTVRYAYINQWLSPVKPQVRVVFNQPVSQKSVKTAMYVEANHGKPVAVDVQKDTNNRQLPRYIRPPGEPFFIDFGARRGQAAGGKPGSEKLEGEEARMAWIISPVEDMPLNTSVHIKVRPGLESAFGAEKGVEERVAGQFHTFPSFYFVGIECRNLNNTTIFIYPGTNWSEESPCNPMRPISLKFSTPVAKEDVVKNLAFTPDLAGGRKDVDVWEMVYGYTQIGRVNHNANSRYYQRLPFPLKAGAKYSIKGAVKDLFGRDLDDPVDITFYIGHRPPDFKLVHKQAVLEQGVDSELPLYITNIDEVTTSYTKLTPQGREFVHDYDKPIKPPKAQDVSFAIPLDIRQKLNGQSGIVYGKIQTKPATHRHGYDNTFLAQVTPYQVLVKKGHFNTIVWVTDMKTGEPVSGARVSLYEDSYTRLDGEKITLAEGVTDENGLAVLAGYSEYDPSLVLGSNWYHDDAQRHFIQVRKGARLAFVPLDSNFQIDSYRISGSVWPRQNRKNDHIRAWGATPQGIYRAGDRIEYKIYVRNQDLNTFTPAPKGKYQLTVHDPMGKKIHEQKDITLSEFGAFHGEFTTSKSGAVGWHRFTLEADFVKRKWTPLRVLVSDFTPSPFKVETSVNGDLFRAGDQMEVTARAMLHSGGPYTGASARITAQFQQTAFTPKNQLATGFYFRTGYSHGRSQFFQETAPMSDKGELNKKISLEKISIIHGRISVEAAVADDRGKNVTSMARIEYRGRDRLVGLKNTRWLYKSREESAVEFLVADDLGEPAPGVDVHLAIVRREIKTSRVKGPGNAYLTQKVESWVDEGSCDSVSGEAPGSCPFTPTKPGLYKFIASIKDTKERAHSTELYGWVIGKGYVSWDIPDDYSLQIIPEKNEYAVGDTARYLVQNPYPGALALITVERFGVIDRWVQTFDESTAVVEFPVKPDYIPGFYLSVAVVSPRVEKPNGLGKLDLGKPAFRMGYVTAPVRDEYKMIDTTVTTDKKEYRPRDTVTVTLNAKPRHPVAGKQPPVEIAVVALDEAVLDLLQGGTSKYDPYSGFYKLDPLDVINFSTLTRLIGRQKFEKKGANAGGGGGGGADLATRSLFKFVAYWNPSVPVDAEGNAKVTFKAPDNLTGWRVLAMAVTPEDRMGLGQRSFKVNRPTEARPVMPNQVTEGDTFKAGFNVMNRTGKQRSIQVRITAKGDVKTKFFFGSSSTSTVIDLAPYKRETVWLDVVTKRVEETADKPEGEIVFHVTAGDEMDTDAMIHKTPVKKRRVPLTAANYGSTTEKTITESIKLPEDIHPDWGYVGVVLSPSVIGNVEGAFEYMRFYPYICWEQKLSKGVMASHYNMLKSYLPDSLKWPGSKTLPQATLDMAVHHQAPNGGMTYYVARDMYVSPYLSAYTMLAFNWMRRDGHEVPSAVEEKLAGYLRNLLRRNVYPDWYSNGMASTVRAVALAAMVNRGKAGPAEVRRYAGHVERMSLFGKAHFMMAALKFQETAQLAKSTAETMLGHANQTGGKFILSESYTDGYSRIMESPLRSNCAALSAFSSYAATAEGKTALGDVPFKMVRFITQSRGKRNHFENTQENMFCMNALVEYSRAYESVRPDMKLSASLGYQPLGKTEFTDVRDNSVELSTPMKKSYAGRKLALKVDKAGQGRYYYSARVQYAPRKELAQRQNAGIDIRKEFSIKKDGKWTLLNPEETIHRGDLVRVDIFLSLPAARNFVVVDDPVPGGLEPVNTDLATSSAVDAAEARYQASGGSWYFQFTDWSFYNTSMWSFYHKELRHDSARFYSEYLPPGNYHLSYMAQAIATGRFAAMPPRAEEMYDPDVFGLGLSRELDINE